MNAWRSVSPQAQGDLLILQGIPAYIRSDNGSDFLAKAVQEWIAVVGERRTGQPLWGPIRPRRRLRLAVDARGRHQGAAREDRRTSAGERFFRKSARQGGMA